MVVVGVQRLAGGAGAFNRKADLQRFVVAQALGEAHDDVLNQAQAYCDDGQDNQERGRILAEDDSGERTSRVFCRSASWTQCVLLVRCLLHGQEHSKTTEAMRMGCMEPMRQHLRRLTHQTRAHPRQVVQCLAAQCSREACWRSACSGKTRRRHLSYFQCLRAASAGLSFSMLWKHNPCPLTLRQCLLLHPTNRGHHHRHQTWSRP